MIDLYRRHGLAWTEARGERMIERAWIDRFVALAGAGAPILDLGCATGRPIADHLIAHGYEVTGVDSAEPTISGR